MPWLEKSAARGEPRAQYIVGTAAFNGDFLPRDPVRGYALMQRANEAGLAQAAASLANMEPLLTPAQKTQGLAMAQELARTERNARLALVDSVARPVAKAPSTVTPTSLPPSQPGVDFTPPPMAGDAAPTPTPAPVVVAKPVPAPAQVATVAPKVVVAPAKSVPAAAAPAAAARGKWRIQLGAFSSRANAEALWTKLSKSGAVAGLEADYQSAGKLTRVRTGAYASRGEAEAVCRVFRARGQGCFPVAR
jgi:cell division septation protein DedD